MNRREYMDALGKALGGVDEATRAEILADYEEHFDQSARNGLSEDDVIAALGSVEECAEAVRELTGDAPKTADGAADTAIPSAAPEAKVGGAPTKLVVEAISADVTVRPATNGATAEYRGRREYEALFYSEIRGDEWHVGLRRDRMTYSGEINIDIGLPAEIRELELTSASGEFTVEGITGDRLKLSSASGDIDVRGCVFPAASIGTKSGDALAEDCRIGDLEMRTVSGDLRLCRVSGKRVTAVSASADIWAKDIKYAEASVHSASGDAEIRGGEFGGLYARSASGDVNASAVSARYIESNTVSGDASISVSGLENASVSAVSGSINLDLQNATGCSGTIRTRSGEGCVCFMGNTAVVGSGSFTAADGSVKLNLSSISGDVTVRG